MDARSSPRETKEERERKRLLTKQSRFGLILCVIFLISAAPLIILGAIWLQSSTALDRAAKIAAYNTAVGTWTNGGMATWKGAVGFAAQSQGSFTVVVEDPTRLVFTSSLTPPAPVDSDSTIDVYSSAFKVAYIARNGTDVLDTNVYAGGSVSRKFNFFFGTKLAYSLLVDIAMEVLLSPKLSGGCPQGCCQGSLAGEYCVVFYQLDSICLIYDATGGFTGDGCALKTITEANDLLESPFSEFHASNNTMPTRNKGRAVLLGQTSYTTQSSRPNTLSRAFDIRIMSNLDPWVVAAKLSDGYMNFGTLSSYSSLARLLLIPGIIIFSITVGCIIVAQLIRAKFCCCCKCCRRIYTYCMRKEGGRTIGSGIFSKDSQNTDDDGWSYDSQDEGEDAEGGSNNEDDDDEGDEENDDEEVGGGRRDAAVDHREGGGGATSNGTPAASGGALPTTVGAQGTASVSPHAVQPHLPPSAPDAIKVRRSVPPPPAITDADSSPSGSSKAKQPKQPPAKSSTIASATKPTRPDARRTVSRTKSVSFR